MGCTLACKPSHESVHDPRTGKTPSSGFCGTQGKAGPHNKIFYGVCNGSKERQQALRDGADSKQNKSCVAPSHRNRHTESISSERLPTHRHSRRRPSISSTTSTSSVASGFSAVSEDILFLTSELAKDVGHSVLRTSLQDDNLCVWHLSKNDLGDRGAFVVAEALTSSTKLDLLGLGHNSITDVGAALVVEAMERTAAPIRVACFANNDIGDLGATALASALPRCPALQVLDLRSNCLGPEGAKLLAEALQQPGCALNCSLKKLQLGNNQVGDEGARALAAALKNCPSLEELALEENGISDEGAAALAEALKDGATLLLCGNLLTPTGKRAVRSAKNTITRTGACCTVGL